MGYCKSILLPVSEVMIIRQDILLDPFSLCATMGVFLEWIRSHGLSPNYQFPSFCNALCFPMFIHFELFPCIPHVETRPICLSSLPQFWFVLNHAWPARIRHHGPLMAEHTHPFRLTPKKAELRVGIHPVCTRWCPIVP